MKHTKGKAMRGKIYLGCLKLIFFIADFGFVGFDTADIKTQF